MAIINPSRKFEGGEMNVSLYGQTIRAGVRVINFRDEENKAGVYLFILPPYKQDSEGNGVWYKVFKVRDNFGLDIKEKFAVQQNCPVDYFASKAKLYFPNYTKIESAKKDGRDIKVYPAYGRTTQKVLFNVAYFRKLQLGAHVLEVPQYGAADQIDKWTKSKNAEGYDAPLLNDYKASIPIEFKLVKDAKGNPWSVQIDASKTYPIPVELADSVNLYDLDAVIDYPSKEQLIEKLRKIVPNNMFHKCLEGYSDGTITVGFSAPTHTSVVEEDSVPMDYPTSSSQVSVATAPITPVIAPTFNIPRASIPQGSLQPNAVEAVKPASQAATANPINGIDIEAARKFLKK